MRRILAAVLLASSLVLLISVAGSTNDVPLPEVSLATDTLSVSEDAGETVLDVTLSASSALAVTVDYATVAETAFAGQDFVLVTGTLIFTPGTTLQTAHVTVLNDTLAESDETSLFLLTNTVGANLGTYPTTTVTITDDGDPYLVYLPLVARRWPPLPYPDDRPDTPTLYGISNSDGDGNYSVTWSSAARATSYQLQEDDNSSFSSPAAVYTGSQLFWTTTNRGVGTYYYRVRATGPTGSSDWSNTQSTQVVPPPPPPMPGVNVVCNQVGNAQICASVSNATPVQYSNVTVYGRLLMNGVGQSGLMMNTTWHYKTTTSYCSGITDANGLAQCIRSIGGATSGYRVNVDVAIQGYSVTTWFTPQ